MDELRIPKHEISAQLTLEGGEVRRVTLFLADAAFAHTGAERLSDLLNGPSEFLPAKSADGTGFAFISRSAIVLVRTSHESPVEVEAWEPVLHFPVEVKLSDGTALRGALEYAEAPEHARVLDYLARPTQFFSLHHQDDFVLINKRHTLQVTPLDG